MAAKKRSTARHETSGWLGGARRALRMLSQVERLPGLGDLCCLEPQYRPGKHQQNVVLEHLQDAIAAGPEAVDGFCCVLSGYVAVAASGCVPESRNLAHYVNQQARAEAAAGGRQILQVPRYSGWRGAVGL